MSEPFRVRLATPADADPISWHRVRMFQVMGQVPEHLFETFRTQSRDRLREMLASGEYIGWLAAPGESLETIVAGAGVQLRFVLPHPASRGVIAQGRHAMIVNVFTEPEWRRRGLGALLLKQIIEWSGQERIDRLLLHASDQGRRLYERLGFIPTNEMKYAGDPSNLGDELVSSH